MADGDRQRTAANTLIAVLTRRQAVTIEELKATLRTDTVPTASRTG